jgi:pantothenate kinase
MDGYHYPRATLATFPNADEAFRRRGAPFTFDSERFARDVKTLRSAGEFTFPAFDHAAKDPVEAAVHVSSGSSKVVLFEGLYLFLESDPGFRRVCHMLDERWFIAADVDDAMARLAERHVRTGVAASLEEAKARVDANDRPNAELVDAQCRPSATRLIWSVHDEDFDTWKVE